MKEEQVELVVLGERSSVRDDESTELDVVIEVRCDVAPDLAAGTSAGAMNLCLVVDRSGSMGGDKLETAKRSCVDIFNRLGQRDLFTVVVFDDGVQVVVTNPKWGYWTEGNRNIAGQGTC
ncbi:VWA domain-containing protein [Frankia sp. Cj3]|uniref:VWA domain-containing protein n=1 Tax=Frankia sp. Cj3 TaxID=2880976 RepID=UPI001EF5E4A0|nr:VWA domain-containing protein [Frankia sp. Cj3]